MSRNFGLPSATSPTTVGGNQSPGSHSRAGQRDSNVVELFPLAASPHEGVDSADADFAALMFSIGAFWSPWVIVGITLIIYSLFF